jgi:3'-5' exonuclease
MKNLDEKPMAPLLIFDIETVPDIELLGSITSPEGFENADAAARWCDSRWIDPSCKAANFSFPPHMYHAVVSICAIFVHPESYVIFDGFKKTLPMKQTREEFLAGERDLLESFWQFSMKHKDFTKVWYDSLQSDFRFNDFQRKKLKPVPVTFCGYNIVGFDLPVIEQRSMRHFLTCPVPGYGKETGYDSYRSKFAPDKTFDICHYLAAQGASKTNLQLISRSIGLGGKMVGMDGSKVAEAYYDARQSDTIEEYCAVDVLITYGVLLAVQKFRGLLVDDAFLGAVAHFQKFLLQEGKPTAYRELEKNSQEYFSILRSG